MKIKNTNPSTSFTTGSLPSILAETVILTLPKPIIGETVTVSVPCGSKVAMVSEPCSLIKFKNPPFTDMFHSTFSAGPSPVFFISTSTLRSPPVISPISSPGKRSIIVTSSGSDQMYQLLSMYDML